jgi:hypothetical protein
MSGSLQSVPAPAAQQVISLRVAGSPDTGAVFRVFVLDGALLNHTLFFYSGDPPATLDIPKRIGNDLLNIRNFTECHHARGYLI